MKSLSASEQSLATASPTTSSESPESASPAIPPNGDDVPTTAPAAPASLPPGITPGDVVKLGVPGDKPVLVAHARASVRRAAIYLHGVCGDIDAVRSWAKAASEHFTLIALYADERCGDGGRYRWTGNTSAQERRIEAALAVVKQARGNQLDSDRNVLFGYSQGALRALALHAQFPARYPWLVLGGLPTETPASRVAGAQRLVLLAGEREAKSHIEATAQHFAQGGVDSKLFLLPKAGHGQYGPEAPQVMGAAFHWLLE
ncbi:MAG: alpha/beta hydrolase [Polyangiaceae bacterium]